tara:strand:+ start:469 stop:690 length:222 start_codon:yes stop_codon:yes gene_type:complete
MKILIDQNAFDILRLSKGFKSRASVGTMAGLSAPQISSLLSNRYSPTLATLSKICTALECQPEEVLKCESACG